MGDCSQVRGKGASASGRGVSDDGMDACDLETSGDGPGLRSGLSHGPNSPVGRRAKTITPYYIGQVGTFLRERRGTAKGYGSCAHFRFFAWGLTERAGRIECRAGEIGGRGATFVKTTVPLLTYRRYLGCSQGVAVKIEPN